MLKTANLEARYGRIPAGENIVLVVAASAHREAAFQARENIDLRGDRH